MIGVKHVVRTALAAALGMGLGLSAAYAETKIGIAQFGKHPQLDETVTAFKAELVKLGIADAVFDELQVNFDATLIPQMVTKLASANPKLILAVTTPVAQGARQIVGNTGTPVVFAAVTDPVVAKLTPSWEAGDKNMTGASDLQDVNSVVKFIKQLLPDAKRLAYLYNPGEDNDVAVLKLIKEAAAAQGLTVVEVGLDNTNDIPMRVSSLAGKADVIYVPASNLVQPAVPAVAAAALSINIPIVNASAQAVRDGLVAAAFEVSYTKVGQNAAKLAAEIIAGKSVATLAPIKPSYADHTALINEKVLEKAGHKAPDSFKDCGCFVK
ncbi:ABC transporter substrate-binding protein [Phyllobacterium sp. 22229]|jgi:putative tryptophan/tyrosine transport system substrate-binding protein|uniref:ABC transporter n=1 Tax=Phyllobacterium myrsinacearum TaxID=28101 RepID=A0A2S9JPI1_9HYPH|nr:ABC transporter substrate-binding protein [Phyllobacterium myrsinacearum]PRD55148.1 ABC transporter [Phyllobacterium myrsinacearum]PWV90282.1 putative ABC transport system substrate-binding protein [Phyllobacterium myrsinacearum]RZS79684.1 putative ABC transport system substrate-binding protein [Phyllobacterium myrsinacearum]RZV05523.1 putative ABC transport system substrate-binding protein [Phyllobacterium myrsinacearum]